MATPIFHAAAAPSTHIGALASGHVIYLLRRFELETFLRSVEKYAVTDVVGVPPIIVGIVMSPLAKSRQFFASVKRGTCGAAPLDKETQLRFEKMLGEDAAVTQVWGMTETSCIATKFSHSEADHTGSVGRPIANLGMKYVCPFFFGNV